MKGSFPTLVQTFNTSFQNVFLLVSQLKMIKYYVAIVNL